MQEKLARAMILCIDVNEWIAQGTWVYRRAAK